MKGPYTIRRDELTENYRWKAENIVRFFDKLGMSKREKETFLAQEFAGIHMSVEITYKGAAFLERARLERGEGK